MMDLMMHLMTPTPPNREMLRLRDMLDAAGIEWHDASDGIMCRTHDTENDDWTFSAICGYGAYGTIELWTKTMKQNREDPIGLNTAEEAFALIRKEVGA